MKAARKLSLQALALFVGASLFIFIICGTVQLHKREDDPVDCVYKDSERGSRSALPLLFGYSIALQSTVALILMGACIDRIAEMQQANRGQAVAKQYFVMGIGCGLQGVFHIFGPAFYWDVDLRSCLRHRWYLIWNCLLVAPLVLLAVSVLGGIVIGAALLAKWVCRNCVETWRPDPESIPTWDSEDPKTITV